MRTDSGPLPFFAKFSDPIIGNYYFIQEEKLMRTILKLKSKNKEEAINALKTAMGYLENDVTNDEIKIWYKLSKLTKIEKRMFL